MAHRSDPSKDTEKAMSRKAKHAHNWVQTREVKRGKYIYVIWTCTNPGCPKGIKIEVHPSGNK